jgi:O-antigen/teichoic acid export membrane protein
MMGQGDRAVEIRGSLLARNSLLNFIGQVVPLFVGVVSIPLIVRGLGTERFGLLALAWVIVGHSAIFDLGLGRATIKFVAEALGKGQEEEVPHLVWTAVTVQVILGLIGALVLVGLTPVLVERILNIPPGLIGEARTTFYLLAFTVPIVIISSSFQGVQEAYQRFDLVNAVKIPTNSFTYLLPLVGLLLGFRLPGIVLLILLARFGALVTFVAMNLRQTPELKRCSVSLNLFPSLFSFGGWVTLSNIIGPILQYFDRFVIGSLLTMSTVAYYTVPFEVITRLWIIPSSLVLTLFPAFSRIAIICKEDLQRLYVRSIKYLFLSTGPIVLILVVFADDILRLWLGVDFARQSTVVFQILLLGTLVGLLSPVSGALLQGLGRPDILAKLYLLYLPPNIGLVWLLVQTMGIAGAALSFALRTFIDSVLLFIISAKLIHLPYSFIEKNLWRTLTALLTIGGSLWMMLLNEMLLFRIGLTIVLVLAYAVIVWRHLLDEMDKKVIVSNIPKFLPPKGG